MRTALLLLLATVIAAATLPACRTGPPGATVFDGGGAWTAAGVEEHPALREGVMLEWWARGTGPDREKVGALRTPDGVVRPGDLADLARWCRPIDSGAAAREYAHAAWLLDTPGLPIGGTPVVPDPSLDGMGGNGRCSPADARAWDIELDPPPRPSGGGWEMQRIVLVAPRTHPDLQFTSPWRLVLLRTVVYPDGAISVVDERTLTNGRDAQRFLRF